MRHAPADAAERDRAIHERDRNVLVDAGAGTGKTSLLIERILCLVAPEAELPALPLGRVVAITFTRKAAGELKLRLREALLSARASSAPTPRRRQHLERALSELDNAPVGTVHSFADRLLRLRPAAAGISPSYEILEDASELVSETTRWLLSAAQSGELPAEPAETLRIYGAAGLRVEELEHEYRPVLGLSSFVRDVIETRDRTIPSPELPVYDPGVVEGRCRELADELARVKLRTAGAEHLRRYLEQANRIPKCKDVAEALRRAVSLNGELGVLNDLRKGVDFDHDPVGWGVRNWITTGKRGGDAREGGPLGAALIAPLVELLAKRLLRLRPYILAHYAALKRSRGVLDHVDLLIKLRDLLRDDREARAFYQARIDHMLVDEFQDTDPLQAEIVLYLCEAGVRASSLAELALQPGKLTIVGDPKQSIYRFRRADIAMYAEVCERLRRSGACEARLSVNFRSAPDILRWLNAGFDAVLGAESEGPVYDPEAGTVRNLHLSPGDPGKPGGVRILPFGDAQLRADPSRDLEGEALARYLRYLVEESGLQIQDPRTRSPRRPRYGDIAVMMIATPTVHHLLTELDRIGVPHVVRGGTLFMQDPLHQQFVLGLRAIADGGDGLARAALFRPPFFAVSLEDLARERCLQQELPEPRAARALLSELRRERHQMSPGELARRALERTGFGAFVAAGKNGAQRLSRLYALCSALDDLARERGLDFDGVTELARGWLDAPPQLEAPLPVDADAVQVITAHQAKGLEWPIVALWDGRASFRAYLPQVCFTVDAIRGEWALSLSGLTYDPTERELHRREATQREAERRRLAYVAATRARDWLIVPEAGGASASSIAGQLLLATRAEPHERLPRYERASRGWWDRAVAVSMLPLVPQAPQLAEAWNASVTRAFTPRIAPLAITAHAHGEDLEGDASSSRFGPVFGLTVHRALQLMLEKDLRAEAAVARAAETTGLQQLLAEVLADVQRTSAGLRAAGLLSQALCLEYPVAGALNGESLLAGAIDLLVVAPDAVSVIDFKTDRPPEDDVARAYPGYVRQVQTYARVLEQSGVFAGRALRQALLFTGDGQLRWV